MMLRRSSWVYLFVSTTRVRSFHPSTTRQACLTTLSRRHNMSSYGEGLADIGAGGGASNNESIISSSSSSSSSSLPLSWRQLLQESSNRTRHIRGSNYVQVATTAAADGSPRCRTLVFRGFLEGGPGNAADDDDDDDDETTTCDDLPCIMKMVTHARSEKTSQIAANARAELVWWFPATMEQYRIRGRLVLVGSDDNDDDDDDDDTTTSRADDDHHDQHNNDGSFWQWARRAQWEQLSDATRASFYDAQVPGQPWSATAAARQEAAAAAARRDDDQTGRGQPPPPDSFVLMLLVPEHCDYLRLGGGATGQYRQVDERQANGSWTSLRVNP